MPKHAFFFWLAMQDRLSTCDRLAKRVGTVICYVFSAEISVKQGIIYSFECFFPSRIWKRVVWDCLRQQVSVHWHKVMEWDQ